MAYSAGASSGNLVLIQKQVASASASLLFTTGITGYDKYQLTFYDVTTSTADTSLQINFSTDGGATYDSSAIYYQAGWSASVIIGAVVSQAANATNQAYIATPLGTGSAADGAAGETLLYSLNSSTVNKTVISTFMGNSTTYGPCATDMRVIYANTAVVNAFKIIASAGNITTGTFKLYGVQN